MRRRISPPGAAVARPRAPPLGDRVASGAPARFTRRQGGRRSAWAIVMFIAGLIPQSFKGHRRVGERVRGGWRDGPRAPTRSGSPVWVGDQVVREASAAFTACGARKAPRT